MNRPTVLMNRRTVLRAALGTAGAVALGGALAGDVSGIGRGPSGVLHLATGEPTAFYEAFGHLLADELTAAHPGLQCRVRTTAGSVDNIERLRDGRADLALVLTATARDAAGTDVFPRPVPLRAIGRVYETYLQFAVRADADVRTVADLRGHVVSLGAPGSGAAVFGERLLHAAGLSPRTDVRVRHLPLNDAASAMAAGSVDGLLVAGGVPCPRSRTSTSGQACVSCRWPSCCPGSAAGTRGRLRALNRWRCRRTRTGLRPGSPPSVCPTSWCAAPTSTVTWPTRSPACWSGAPHTSSPATRWAPSSSTSAA